MIKTILVPVTGDPSDDAVLETAYLIARLFDGHLQCLHVAPRWTDSASYFAAENSDSTLRSAELVSALEEQRKAIAWRAQRHFAELCRRWNIPLAERPQARTVSAAWKATNADGLETVVAEARFYDLLVLGRTPDANPLGSLILSTGRPVLLVPKQAPENLAPTIAIAWKDTPESARALTAAMPLLRKADKILVLSADQGKNRSAAADSAERITRTLRWHGLSAEPLGVVCGEHSLAEAIAQSAQHKRADLLVMGAYGHSRLAERVLGGATRGLLNSMTVPVLMSH